MEKMNTALSGERFNVEVEEEQSSWGLRSPLWGTMLVDPLNCGLRIGGKKYLPRKIAVGTSSDNQAIELKWTFPEISVVLTQRLSLDSGGSLNLYSELINLSPESLVLNDVELIRLEDPPQSVFGNEQGNSRVYEESGYLCHVRELKFRRNLVSESAEPAPGGMISGASQTCWVIYNRADHMGLLVGFTSFDRWLGTIRISYDPMTGIKEWVVGHDGGDLRIDPEEKVRLENVTFSVGNDPWSLLEDFGDLIKEKHRIRPLENPPVTWCSWYPYRLGVSEEHVLANEKIAATRLKPLRLRNFQIDLGWQMDCLPNTYEENERFPRGLKWLSEETQKLGFNLGIWTAPFTISEFSPLYREHPDWLLGDLKEKPKPYWTWFWEPHGKVYALDLTQPKALAYVRENVMRLAEKGVKYFKLDFIGGPCNPILRNRHDPKMVAGGGTEAVRLGSKAIAEAVKGVDPESLLLNCNPYEVCGLGFFDLLYACNDTGNTGYVTWATTRENYTSVACHLWKNHRLGIIQPSCLCVGLPGILEEARMRATATFLSGGEVDIGDDLTTLPEDRWNVLLSILPPLSQSAKPIDLFDALTIDELPYSEMAAGVEKEPVNICEADDSRVWCVPIKTDWDEWIVVGLFAWNPPVPKPRKQENPITRFRIPWKRLRMDVDKDYWIYEFWSGQFLGKVADTSDTPKGYVHPGDARSLIWGSTQGTLQVSFFGPSAKLLVIREARDHPWVVGTSFHATGGSELKDVRWDESRRSLSGVLERPSGQQGFIVLGGLEGVPVRATIEGLNADVTPSANGSLKIPILTSAGTTRWNIEMEHDQPIEEKR